MIPVAPAPEPASFDERVRQPGLVAIGRLERGEISELPSHWSRCAADMLQAYGRICAYACLYIPEITGGPSVEHFAPKSSHRSQAYEWVNYRLVCAMLNSRKRDFEDVLDPFVLGHDVFALNLVTLRVVPGQAAQGLLRAEASATIRRLGLDQPDYAAALNSYLGPYQRRQVTFDFLEERAPFLAREMRRQNRA